MTELPIMKHIVLTTIGCQPCKQLEAYLIANQTTSWSWIYHHIRPELFDVLAVSSTPTIVAQVGANEYKVMAIGLQDCIEYHRVWKHPSSIIDVTKEEEE